MDYFGRPPGDIAPLPSWPGQAVSSGAATSPPAIPTRTEPGPTGATATSLALEHRLVRDALRDSEIARLAAAAGLEVTIVDG